MVDTDFTISKPGYLLAKFVNVLCYREPSLKDPESIFRLEHEPPLSLTDFAFRLESYFACSAACFVAAAAYLVRLKNIRPDMFDLASTHKLLLTSLTVAAKFCEDRVCKQTHYAKCGGIEVAELSALEREFFALLNSSCFLGESEFARTVRVLKSMRGVRIPELHQRMQFETPQKIVSPDQTGVVAVVRGSF